MSGNNRRAANVRDLLAPGLRAELAKGYEFDIRLDGDNRDSLELVAWRISPVVRRTITAAELADGSYKAKFRPLILEMERELDGMDNGPRQRSSDVAS